LPRKVRPMVEFNIMETMLSDGQDNALIRFTMGSAFIKHGKFEEAIEQLAKAVELEPDYSAAWQRYGWALAESGRTDKAIKTFQQGIAVAKKKGDDQTAKEMQIFLNRLQK
jgi:Flp pilus assembly protein TadD